MYEKLTLEHSLFLMQEQDLKDFQTLASKYIDLIEETSQRKLLSLNDWVVVLNIWCVINEEERRLHLNFEKSMVYSSHFYVLTMLERDAAIKKFVKARPIASEHYKYVLAFLFAEEAKKWIRSILEGTSFGRQLLYKNLSRDYYMLYKNEEIALNPNHCFYKEQQLVTKAIARNIMTTDDYLVCRKTAFNRTIEYFNEQLFIDSKIN